MRDKKALSVLINHKAIIDAVDYDKLFLWQRQSLSYIERFLGKDSEEFRLMNSFTFPNYQDKDYDERLKVTKQLLQTAMEQSIQTVKNLGIVRVYHNFLCRYSDKELIAGILAVAGAIFGAGYAIANHLQHCPPV